jgi:AraC-like DNA-binding protein
MPGKSMTMSVAVMTGVLDMVARKGTDPDLVLRTCGLDRSILADRDGFVSTGAIARFLEEAALATADDCFGLHFGNSYNPKNIGPMIYTALNSPTIGVAIENIERFFKIHDRAARWFEEVEGERAYVGFEAAGLAGENIRQYNEMSIAIALNTLQIMAGSQWSPLEIHFTHDAPPQISEHVGTFRAPVQFACSRNALVVEREFLTRQIPAADPRLYQILQRYLEVERAAMPTEDSFLVTIRKAIAASMRDGDPKLLRVAKAMAASPRTLQRKLKVYGLDFKQLLEDTRRRFALDYLKDAQHTLTEIAFLLGYSDVTAFNRAFKRWTGRTPSDYRTPA